MYSKKVFQHMLPLFCSVIFVSALLKLYKVKILSSLLSFRISTLYLLPLQATRFSSTMARAHLSGNGRKTGTYVCSGPAGKDAW